MSVQFRKRGETPIYRGSLISVASVELEAPDGSRFEREIVKHPGAVVVVPVTAEGRVVMVRQFRAALGRELLEIPAGKRDVEGEPTEVTAERELAEEVGRRAGRLDLLARFYNSPGFSTEYTWLYLARDLEEVPVDRQGIEEQHMAVEEIPLDRYADLVGSGEIEDAKTIVGLALALHAVQADSTAGRPDGSR